MAILFQKLDRLEHNSKWRMSKPLRITLYLTSFAILGFVALYPKPAQAAPMKWSRLHNSLFISLSRPAFIIAIMVFMLLLMTSKRNLMMRVLSHDLWLPFARLSYLVYLVFPICMAILLSQLAQPLMLSLYSVVNLLAYSIVSSFTTALVAHFFVEGPLQQFTKKIYLSNKVLD